MRIDYASITRPSTQTPAGRWTLHRGARATVPGPNAEEPQGSSAFWRLSTDATAWPMSSVCVRQTALSAAGLVGSGRLGPVDGRRVLAAERRLDRVDPGAQEAAADQVVTGRLGDRHRQVEPHRQL